MTADATKTAADTDPSRVSGSMDRRNAIRLLSTLGGAALGSLVLPPRWDAPRLEFGLLPAHADCSGRDPGCAGASSGCAIPTCVAGYGAFSMAFSSASPAAAGFDINRAQVFAGNLFAVQIDRTTQNVTITPSASTSSVASATAGQVTGGVLTYPWNASSAPVTVNVLYMYSDSCTNFSMRATVDIGIVYDGNNYTLNVSNLNTGLCSYN